ncbi:MAG: CPBP family intramembrane metalloprotease, partial [Verrucomicrobiales bacterium]|nr:CPBP family intramembrane metalloprotease [Verrucomicrobiales bacterium]
LGAAVVLAVPFRELLPWRMEWLVIGLTATTPLIVLLIWLMKTSWQPVLEVRRFMEQAVIPFFGNLSILQLLLLAILAGVGEEFFFRAFLQTWLSGILGTVTGLILASLIFGVCHLVTPFYGIFATAMGLYLGGLMLYTGNIWPPVIVHILYDFIALISVMKMRRV